ncbi:MAG TPA: class IV adenylate cyclase [Solirubrobacterales bacterium]|nr:class IV adenylate cyclase [Solirubrobacterales bacterium]
MAERENVELKARVESIERSRRVCEELEAEPCGDFAQRDTYFEAAHGRLKLREEEGSPAQLISYRRPDAAEARSSRFRLVPVADPGGLRQALSETLGVRAVVAKRRHLYLWEGVRIHLDEVEGLGTFVEFEAPVRDGAGDGAWALVERLRAAFAIAAADLVAESYVDLAEAHGAAAGPPSG